MPMEEPVQAGLMQHPHPGFAGLHNRIRKSSPQWAHSNSASFILACGKYGCTATYWEDLGDRENWLTCVEFLQDLKVKGFVS